MFYQKDYVYMKFAVFLAIITLIGMTIGIFGIYNGVHSQKIPQSDVTTVTGTFDHFEKSNSKYTFGTLFLENERRFSINSIYSNQFDLHEFLNDVEKGEKLYITVFKDENQIHTVADALQKKNRKRTSIYHLMMFRKVIS